MATVHYCYSERVYVPVTDRHEIDARNLAESRKKSLRTHTQTTSMLMDSDSEEEREDTPADSTPAGLNQAADLLGNLPGFLILGPPLLVVKAVWMVMSVMIKLLSPATEEPAEGYDEVDRTVTKGTDQDEKSLLLRIHEFIWSSVVEPIMNAGSFLLFNVLIGVPYFLFFQAPSTVGSYVLAKLSGAYKWFTGKDEMSDFHQQEYQQSEESEVKSPLLAGEGEDEEGEEEGGDPQGTKHKSFLGLVMDFVLCVLYLVLIMGPLTVGTYVWNKLSGAYSYVTSTASRDTRDGEGLGGEAADPLSETEDGATSGSDSSVFSSLMEGLLYLPYLLVIKLPTAVGSWTLRSLSAARSWLLPTRSVRFMGQEGDQEEDQEERNSWFAVLLSILYIIPYGILVKLPVYLWVKVRRGFRGQDGVDDSETEVFFKHHIPATVEKLSGLQLVADFLSDLPYITFVKIPVWILSILWFPFRGINQHVTAYDPQTDAANFNSQETEVEQPKPSQRTYKRQKALIADSEDSEAEEERRVGEEDEEDWEEDNYADRTVCMGWLRNFVNGLVSVLGFLLVSLPTGGFLWTKAITSSGWHKVVLYRI